MNSSVDSKWACWPVHTTVFVFCLFVCFNQIVPDMSSYHTHQASAHVLLMSRSSGHAHEKFYGTDRRGCADVESNV